MLMVVEKDSPVGLQAENKLANVRSDQEMF